MRGSLAAFARVHSVVLPSAVLGRARRNAILTLPIVGGHPGAGRGSRGGWKSSPFVTLSGMVSNSLTDFA
jgi:hypothetical protein